MKAIVTTSINGLTKEIESFLAFDEWDIIYVSDKKTPDFDVKSDQFIHLSCEKQRNLNYNYANKCPWNSFQRKNIGYMYAIKNDYEKIADIDDDNMPYEDWDDWIFNKNKYFKVKEPKLPNIYEHSSEENIWPRGMAIDELKPDKKDSIVTKQESLDSEPAVIQGLVDGDPDVDAICRLTSLGSNPDVKFNLESPHVFEENVWTPFNAQNTLWNREKLLPLTYLPTTVSMRVCDILRSYVAQRVMWENDQHLSFCRPTVYQDRNAHDLLVDFKDEYAVYTDVKDWINVLEDTPLKGDNVSFDLRRCYRSLVGEGYIEREELSYIKAWISDLN